MATVPAVAVSSAGLSSNPRRAGAPYLAPALVAVKLFYSILGFNWSFFCLLAHPMDCRDHDSLVNWIGKHFLC